MKHGVLATTLSALAFALTAHAITVDGHVFLSGQTDHTGTLIMFRAVSPSARTDSTHSFNTGYFTVTLQPGVYDVEFSNDGYAAYTLVNELLLFDTTLETATMMILLSGALSGTLGPGDFDVVDTIRVELGQSLEILPGTRLLFRPRAKMIVQGRLQAIGAADDSIVFTKRYAARDSSWRGILVDDGVNQSRVEFCVVEFARRTSPTGITFRLSQAVLNRSTVRACAGYYGGGVTCYGGAPTVTGCLISGNYGNYGGGISLLNTMATIGACVISTDTANWGGGVYADRGAPSMDSTDIVGNRAAQGGGVYATDTTLLEMSGCLLEDNTAAMYEGGALYCIEHGMPQLVACRLLSNVAMNGCAVYSDGAAPQLTRCTIVGNVHDYVPVVAVEGGSGLVLNSCIVAFTIGGSGVGLWGDAEMIYCAVFGNDNGAISGDGGPPGLGIVALTNANGDSCDTYYNVFLDPQFVDRAAGDYHLTLGSPCIDAGDPGLPYDLDGTIADMGAFYFNQLGVRESGRIAMRPYALSQNYPNPFNAETRIGFDLARAGEVTLEVFDITGRLVRRLVNGRMAEGTHEVNLDARDLPSGVYVYRLTAGEVIEAKKMILIR